MNALTSMGYSRMLGELDLTECMVALVEQGRRVQGGKLESLEEVLAAQAVTLNAMFTQLAFQTSKMTSVDQIDRFTRLALKAQGQCRATVETLAVLKNPPTVFARQANIAHGPQQVNNLTSLSRSAAEGPSRAGTQESEPNKLLEAHGERLVSGATGATGSGDQEVASVGGRDRTSNR